MALHEPGALPPSPAAFGHTRGFELWPVEVLRMHASLPSVLCCAAGTVTKVVFWMWAPCITQWARLYTRTYVGMWRSFAQSLVRSAVSALLVLHYKNVHRAALLPVLLSFLGTLSGNGVDSKCGSAPLSGFICRCCWFFC
jgi:hypothetical protein